MPTITFSDTTFDKLKAISEPFVDTPESRIMRLIDDEIQRLGITVNGNGRARALKDNAVQLSPDSHESLAFTRVRSASIDGREMLRPKWNSVMDRIHVLGLNRL